MRRFDTDTQDWSTTTILTRACGMAEVQRTGYSTPIHLFLPSHFYHHCTLGVECKLSCVGHVTSVMLTVSVHGLNKLTVITINNL